MDFEDTPQEAAFRKKARAWLEKNAQLRGPDDAADELGEREDAGTIAAAKAWQAKKFDEGWAVLTWPKEFGGQGLSRVESVVWGQEEAKFKTPPNIYGIGHGMLGPMLMAHGTPEQKAKYVKEMARGQVVWCQLFSEPAAGSDLVLWPESTRPGPVRWNEPGPFADAPMQALSARAGVPILYGCEIGRVAGGRNALGVSVRGANDVDFPTPSADVLPRAFLDV